MPLRASARRSSTPFRWASTTALHAFVLIGLGIAFAPASTAQCLTGAQLSISIVAPDVVVSSTGDPAPHDVQFAPDPLAGGWFPLAMFPSGTFEVTDPAPPDAHRVYRAVCNDGGALLSQNAVGYIKRSVTTGELQLLGVPLLGPDGVDGTLDELLGAQAGVGSAVYVWERTTDGYVPAIRTGTGWVPNLVLHPGDVLWIDPTPNGGGDSTYDVSLTGDFPSDANGHHTILLAGIAQDFIAFAYPVALEWTDLPMADELPGGSSVYWWDAQNQVFSSMMKDPVLGWPLLLPLEPGDGVFVDSTGGDVSCCNSKPYDWP